MNVSQSLLAAAFGGMVLGAATGCGGGSQSSPEPAMQNAQPAGSAMPMAMDGGGAKHACKGQNDCKGKGGCKTDKHACKGQNDCKGQGGCNG